MIISHLGHSTVLLGIGDRQILIDPGNFSTAWHDLTDLDAIVVTHAHPDHVDPQWAPRLVQRNPGALVVVEPSVPHSVDLPGARPLAAGQVVEAGPVRLEAVGGQHAVIHRDIPRIGNIGLVVAAPGQPRFFHPGDALEAVPPGIDIVAVPAHAPWCAMKETIDFTRALRASGGFLIHDGLINERGWTLTFTRLNEMTDTTFTDLRGTSATW